MKLFLSIVFVLLAFAGNSFFARLAMAESLIDPISFTTLRLVFAALALMWFVRPRISVGAFSWPGALLLYVYALANTLAFITLSTATGALVLFAFVQLTMLAIAAYRGERYRVIQWFGMVIALAGLVAFLIPKASLDNSVYIVSAVVAGVAWGGYSSLVSKQSALVATSSNFLFAAIFMLVTQLALVRWVNINWQLSGLIYAFLSGVLTSAVGYVVWYWVLSRITGGFAATLQLFAPVIAGALGWILLSEALSVSSMLAAMVILVGIGMVAWQRASSPPE